MKGVHWKNPQQSVAFNPQESDRPFLMLRLDPCMHPSLHQGLASNHNSTRLTLTVLQGGGTHLWIVAHSEDRYERPEGLLLLGEASKLRP